MKVWFLVILVCYFSDVLADSVSFTGTAYHLTKGNLIYTEHHQVGITEHDEYRDAKVIYKNNQGNLIASKTLIFDERKTLPDFEFKDTRTGTKIKVKKSDTDFRVDYEAADEQLSNVIAIKDNMVVDAGFDQLLLQKWPQLLAGKTVEFEFLAPTRGELIGFQLIPTKQDKDHIHFVLQPQAWLIRLLVDDIKLTYQKSTKRIIRYEGLTNIEEFVNEQATGGYYEARIEYSY